MIVEPRVHTTHGITVLRAGVAILLAYSVVGLWLQQHDLNPQPVAAIREWVNRPLRLGEDFGPFAVMSLLLCAGYTAALAGADRLWQRLSERACERTNDTGRPRAAAPSLRGAVVSGYLPVLVATVLAAGAVAVGLDVWTTPADVTVSAANLAGNLTFVSHLVAGKALLVPLAWAAGLLLVAILVGLDRWGWPVPAIVLAAIGVLIAVGAPTHLGPVLCFAPLVLIGHVTARVTTGVLPAWAGVLIGAACFAVIAGVDRTVDGLAQWWYPVAATYAVPVFLVAVLVPGRVAATVAEHPVTRWLARYADWVLVLSGVVIFALLGAT